ncbi:MAG TPA: tripartite tricarboxylate transporter substrate-binding protein [Xanthobacteraceae bacterium]|nr:tripartite tricarboxylate transporter substrate-binding protein [Xanthobacteraceae bacterium]
MPIPSRGKRNSCSPPARRASNTLKPGKLRLLAVTEGKRSPLLPDVPTVAETVPGFEMAVWYAAYGPAGLPQEIIARLNGEIGRILFLPAVKKQMADIAVEVAKSSPNELADLTRADANKWGKIIRELNITPM